DRLRDAKLDRLLPHRSHQDPAPCPERPHELDPLDVAVPLRPARNIGPQAPDLIRRGAGLDAVLGCPHGDLLCLRVDDLCEDYLLPYADVKQERQSWLSALPGGQLPGRRSTRRGTGRRAAATTTATASSGNRASTSKTPKTNTIITSGKEDASRSRFFPSRGRL